MCAHNYVHACEDIHVCIYVRACVHVHACARAGARTQTDSIVVMLRLNVKINKGRILLISVCTYDCLN